MRAKFIRGEEPIKSMGIGNEHIYGSHYKLFMELYTMSTNSENFEHVSEIVWKPEGPLDEKDVPYFNIESKFHKTSYSPGRNVGDKLIPHKTAEQYVVFLYKNHISLFDVLNNEELVMRNKEDFDKITRCFD